MTSADRAKSRVEPMPQKGDDGAQIDESPHSDSGGDADVTSVGELIRKHFGVGRI